MSDGTIPEVYVGINDKAFRSGIAKAETHMKSVVAAAETGIKVVKQKHVVDVDAMRAKAVVAEQELAALMGQYDMAEVDFTAMSNEIEGDVAQHYQMIDDVKQKAVVTVEEAQWSIEYTKSQLKSLELETEVKLNTIHRGISMAKNAGFQLLDFMGIAVDTSLKGVIDTGFATGRFLLSMKAATTVEALANPFAWLRVAALATSYFMTVASTIKMALERQRIAGDFEKLNRKAGAAQVIRRTIRI